MLKQMRRVSLFPAALAVLLLSLFTLGCGSETEVTISAEDMQRQVEQLSPEQQEQIRRNQEAIASTATQLPTQGLTEEQQAERNEALRRVMPMPPSMANPSPNPP